MNSVHSICPDWIGERRLAAVLATLLIGLTPLASTNAATINVTTTADTVANDGLTSIREAFQIASSNAQDDTIVLAPSASYTLDNCVLGPFDYSEAFELIIEGGNASLHNACPGNVRTIDATAVFQDVVLDVRDLILTGNAAMAAALQGAAIRMSGLFANELKISNSSITTFGGVSAVRTESVSTVTLNAVTVSNNAGDGISLSFGALTANNITFSNNGGDGLSLIDGSPVSINNSTVTMNGEIGIFTTGQGDSDLTVTNSTVDGNGETGIICANCSTTVLTNVIVTNNGSLTGQRQGGVSVKWQIDSAINVPQLTITDSTIENNDSAMPGGGLRLDNTGMVPPMPLLGTVNIINTSISHNTSAQSGGGIWAPLGNFSISAGSVIDHNTAGFGTTGGGIFINGDTDISGLTSLQIDASSVDQNTATAGAGIHYSGDGSVAITDSTISGNQADLDAGGGMRILHTDLHLLRATVADNSAFAAGGIGFGSSTDTVSHLITIQDSTISGNADTSGLRGGGGLIADGPVSVSIVNSTISGNITPTFGGGMLFGGMATLSLNHVTMVDNAAADGSNLAFNEGIVTVTKSILATPQGGGTNCLFFGSGALVATAGFSFTDDTSCALGFLDTVLAIATGLGPLSANGGPTETHLPADGTIVAGLVPIASCTDVTDQRGQVRPQGNGCEPGAVEISDSSNAAIMGSEGNDLLFGTPGDDLILGRGGNDLIFGLGGNDTIHAGDGRDHVFGGGGDDAIFGEDGEDWLFGNHGDDTLDGGGNNDKCFGGRGTDLAIDCEKVVGVP